MTTIGVTGGIGSGKSTVCRMLAGLGARVFDADSEARHLMQADPAVRKELTEAFGPSVYHADGALDRAWVAERIFGDESAVARIGAIVHPRVQKAWREARERAEWDGVSVLVKEAALLLDSAGGTDGLDLVVVVSAPASIRETRVASRDGLSPEGFRRRMDHQRSDAEFREAADHVIDNDGTTAELEAAVDALWQRIMSTGSVPHLSVRWPSVPDVMPRRGGRLSRALGRLGLRAMRFSLKGDLPPLDKFVVIGAPHTTNWDFVVSMLMLFALGLRIHWVGKHTIFRRPFGGVMRWLGGISVDRSQPGGVVEQVVEQFARHERFAVGLSPEGTRSLAPRWKSGFYRIATAAKVPILLYVIDFGRRELRLDSVFHPTGDFESDMAKIRQSFRPEQARYPSKFQ